MEGHTLLLMRGGYVAVCLALSSVACVAGGYRFCVVVGRGGCGIKVDGTQGTGECIVTG